MHEITGRTSIYPILADPVSHVRAPVLMNAYFEDHGYDVLVYALHVSPKDLARVVDGLRCQQNLIGFSVTVPHKQTMIELVDELTPSALRCGATNAVKRTSDGRLIGAQLDGSGFLSGLRVEEVEPSGANVLLAGAGGAARPIAFELAEAGVSSLTIANRTPARAKSLAEDVKRSFPDCRVEVGPAVADGYDIVINATTLGMKLDDDLPVELGPLGSNSVLADVVLFPEETKFLAAGKERGCRIVPGRRMLEGQFDNLATFLSPDARL